MLPAAHIAHQVDGRVRFRIPSKRRDQDYFDSVTRRLREHEGIRALEINALTGSVLVIHTVDADTIAEYAERDGLFTLVAAETAATPLSQVISEQFHTMDKRIKAKTSGVLDLSGLAFVGLLIASATQLAKKNVWPAGATLLWYATSVLPSARAGHRSPKP